VRNKHIILIGLGIIFSSLILNVPLDILAETKYENGTMVLEGDKNFVIGYSITGENKIDEIFPSLPDKSIVVKLSSNSDGIFSISLPIDKFFMKPDRCNFNPWEPFISSPFVLVDIQEVPFQHKVNNTSVLFQIPFRNASEVIEIIFTFPNDLWKYKYGCPTTGLKYSIVFSPKQQLANGVQPNDVLCKEEFVLIQKSSNNSPACVKPESIPKLNERSWTETEIFQKTIKVSNSDVILRYNIENAELVEIYTDHATGSQIFNLKNSQNGQIMMEFPKLNENCLPEWFVLINGKEGDYNMIETRNSIIFLIHFPENTSEIELVGTSMITGMPMGCSIIN